MKCTYCGEKVRTDKIVLYKDCIKLTLSCVCIRPDIEEVIPLYGEQIKIQVLLNEKGIKEG